TRVSKNPGVRDFEGIFRLSPYSLEKYPFPKPPLRPAKWDFILKGGRNENIFSLSYYFETSIVGIGHYPFQWSRIRQNCLREEKWSDGPKWAALPTLYHRGWPRLRNH